MLMISLILDKTCAISELRCKDSELESAKYPTSYDVKNFDNIN